MGLILVVSDDLVEIETVRAALSVHGWWVTVAGDRETALQSAADQAPKLVLVDTQLPDALELIGSFGAAGGGPGVVALAGRGFEDAPELEQAGADEVLSKPGSPHRILEAVQRCLAVPRPGPAERRVPANRLLTTEEIFGDVLREIGEDDAPAPGAEAAPPPAPLISTADDLFAPAADPDRSVSLAGLFDDPPSAPEAPSVPPAPAEPGREGWRGEERRGTDRPWSPAGPAAAIPESAERRPPVAGVEESDPLGASPVPAASDSALPSGVIEALAELERGAPLPASEDLAELEEPVAAPLPDDEAPALRRSPRSALAIGSLAAALLAAAGAVFLLYPGSDPPPAPAPSAERAREAPPPDSAAIEPAAGGPPAAELAEPPLRQAAPPGPPTDEVEEFDIEAIVDEELQRREDVLRRVFLEEEKRLLRELNNLDSGESADGDESGAD